MSTIIRIFIKENPFFIEELYSLAALNLTIFISFFWIFGSYSSCDSSLSLSSSFPNNLFNNWLEKFSDDCFKFSKTFFLSVKNKLMGFSLSAENIDKNFKKINNTIKEIQKYPNTINNKGIFKLVALTVSLYKIWITFFQLIKYSFMRL